MGGGFVPLSSSSGFGIAPMLQMLIALGIVAFLLKWVLPKLASKWLKSKNSRSDCNLKVVETVPLGSSILHLIEVDNARVLIASHAQGTTMLTVLPSNNLSSQPAIVDSTVRVQQPSKDIANRNKQSLIVATDQPEFEAVLASEEASPPISVPKIDAKNALDRLESLAL